MTPRGNTHSVAERNGPLRKDVTWDPEPVDVSRHLQALRRAWPLILVAVVSMTGAVYLISTQAPKTYEAQARIVVNDRPGGFEPGDVDTIKRRLATVQALLTTSRIYASAAKGLKGESPSSLEDKVSTSVDPEANIVDVKGRGNTPLRAAAIANSVARSFLALELAAERQRVARERTQLVRALGLARGAAERRVIREQLSQLSISASAAGSELLLAEPARPPTEASSPRPVRNAIFSFFGSVFLAVLAALGLGQLAPRVSGGRELSRLTGAPVVAAVPAGRQLRTERGLAESAYRELRRSLAPQLSDDVKTVLVAGDLAGRAKSGVALALGRALADYGAKTLLVSADMKDPRTHELLGASRSPGLSDVLDRLRHGGTDNQVESLLEETIVGTSYDQLDLLPAGSESDLPSPLLLGGDAAMELFAEIGRFDYRHVVLEGPALLDGIEADLLGRYADALLVVCRLDRLSPGNAAEIGESLMRSDVPTAGLVMLGGSAGSITSWPRGPRVRVEA